jgi:hypothetical protein
MKKIEPSEYPLRYYVLIIEGALMPLATAHETAVARDDV